ncbi:MAG: endo-1,4-beta-xylanase [Lentisphaeria bacterium]
MANRADVLKPFEEKRDFMEDRIKYGIEMNRKGFATLTFKNAKGDSLKNAHVEIKQLTHDFNVGANLFMLDEFKQKEQNDVYKKSFADAFNIATIPFYWSDLEPEQGKPRFAKDSPKIYRRPATDLCLEYCEKNGIRPKGHCLNYPTFVPRWVPDDIIGQKKALDKRFQVIAERYSDRIPDWEVTNETYFGQKPHFQFYDDPEFVEWSFKTAERYFYLNKLIINEAHSRIWGNGYYFGNRSPYFMQIERALAKGARIDSIGMQYHMFYSAEEEQKSTAEYYDPERIFAVLDCYSALKRPIQITELTIPAYTDAAEDEDVQAEIIRNLYRMWFSHPAMEAIIYWNLVDGFAYGATPGDMNFGENYYRGGLIRYDFTPKPAYFVIKDLFEKTWRTNLSLDAQERDTLMFNPSCSSICYKSLVTNIRKKI